MYVIIILIHYIILVRCSIIRLQCTCMYIVNYFKSGIWPDNLYNLAGNRIVVFQKNMHRKTFVDCPSCHRLHTVYIQYVLQTSNFS